jgi:spermidine synthase
MIRVIRLAEVNTDQQMAELMHLYESAGWISSEAGEEDELIRRIVAHTYCFAVAYDGERIIGMGRSISDSVSDAYIQDVTVLPEYRQKGIGGMIIDYLVEYLHTNGIGWVGLISEPGYESFYQKLGFSVMPAYTPFLYTKTK